MYQENLILTIPCDFWSFITTFDNNFISIKKSIIIFKLVATIFFWKMLFKYSLNTYVHQNTKIIQSSVIKSGTNVFPSLFTE